MAYFSHSWLPFIYQYGVGLLIFVIGLGLTLKAGSFRPREDPRHRKWLAILIDGYIWYATMHAALTLAALGQEKIAAIGSLVILGVSLLLTVIWLRRPQKEA